MQASSPSTTARCWSTARCTPWPTACSLGITLVVLVLLLFLGRPSHGGARRADDSLLAAVRPGADVPHRTFRSACCPSAPSTSASSSTARSSWRRTSPHRLGHAATMARRRERTSSRSSHAAAGGRAAGLLLDADDHRRLPAAVDADQHRGLLFRPMALTMVFALIGRLLFALFVVPVLATFLFPRGYREWENPVLGHGPASSMRGLDRPAAAALAGRSPSCSCVLAVVVFCVVAAARHRVPALHGRGRDLGAGAIFPKDVAAAEPQLTASECREHRPRVSGHPVRLDPGGPQRQRHRSLSAQPLEMMIGPKPRDAMEAVHDQARADRRDLGSRLRERVSDHALQLHAADHRQRDRGHQRHLGQPGGRVLRQGFRRAARTGPQDARPAAEGARRRWTSNIEQEGPQPQLVIEPDRALCARYNVRIDDVTKLINTALGGEPIGTLYEGERRFDIVGQVRPRVRATRRRPSTGCRCSRPTACRSRCRRWPRSSWWTARR